MTDIIALLTMYYACDAAAAQTLLPKDEAKQCAAIYKTVKMQFLTAEDLQAYQAGDVTRKASIMQMAYLRFKEWEMQNGAQVQDLRQSNDTYLRRG